MAIDVETLQTANQELAQALADMQRAIDQLQQEQSLLELALLHAIEGRWDSAQHGMRSAEAALVARNPALHGKVNAVPFVRTR